MWSTDLLLAHLSWKLQVSDVTHGPLVFCLFWFFICSFCFSSVSSCTPVSARRRSFLPTPQKTRSGSTSAIPQPRCASTGLTCLCFIYWHSYMYHYIWTWQRDDLDFWPLSEIAFLITVSAADKAMQWAVELACNVNHWLKDKSKFNLMYILSQMDAK